ncbi:type II toxin-antitoxin system PemK/MazF family toxin [Fusobacterium nucleatum]|jgi:pemK family DNA-binding protein|uniref:Type II toxin-antitoxin system PemK/MazF family toxin n=2 Tax=Fusobacterium vincentii TaxID=155615 RepID=A0ABV3Y8F4_FUSVC|nr:type II toxin-antitoxin system PemK/MazF family toxin [Fusobacterium vincentii]
MKRKDRNMQIDFSKTNRLIEWLKKMIYLDTTVVSAQKRVVFRGQVYFCELGEGIGSEETKERPCIIIQNNLGNKNSGNIIVAPITNGGLLSSISVTIPSNKYKYTDKTGTQLYLSGNILLGNIVTVSKARLGNFIVDLSKEKSLMEEVDEKIIISIGLYSKFKKLNDTISADKITIEKLKNQRNSLTEKLKNILQNEES